MTRDFVQKSVLAGKYRVVVPRYLWHCGAT